MTKSENKKLRKKLKGEIIGKIDDNTYKVRIETKKAHPLYTKIIQSHKSYLVHYDQEMSSNKELNIGDKIVIEETSPKSKNKKFVIL